MNKSNFVHAAYALLIQLPFLAIGFPWFGAGLAIGFFVGVEWMQEIRHKLHERGLYWPMKITPKLAMEGFVGWGRDRYGDAGMPAVVCILAAVARGMV